MQQPTVVDRLYDEFKSLVKYLESEKLLMPFVSLHQVTESSGLRGIGDSILSASN